MRMVPQLRPSFNPQSLLRLAILLQSLTVAHGSNTTILQITDLDLPPADQFHVALETQFEGPGYVDMAALTFTVARKNEIVTKSVPATYIDIVLVKMADHCFKNEVGGDCDWSANMGVGYLDDSNASGSTPYYCCSKAAQEATICTKEDDGRLLLNPQIFKGRSLNVTVPASLQDAAASNEDIVLHIDASPPDFGIPDFSGTYALLVANCNTQYGRHVVVDGETDWVSYGAELTKFYNENVPFYFVMSILFVALGVWYGLLMNQYKDSRIRLEEWIMFTIALGTADVVARLIQYAVLERGGYNTLTRIFMLSAAIVGGIKHAQSRGLLLMLALGWGVVYPTLNPIATALTMTLTLTYCIMKTLTDLLLQFHLKSDRNFIASSFWGGLAIDVIFLIWIPAALLNTMRYLKASNQLRKLERYRYLGYILLLAISLTVGLFLIALWCYKRGDDGGLSFFNLSQGNEINFLLILTCVAALWKPNPMAREFVYAMELSAQEPDSDDGTMGPLGMGGREGYLADLELTENARHSEMRAASSHSSDAKSEDSTDYTQFTGTSVEVS